MCKKIMILGASELQLPAIKKAKELGIKSIVIDYDSEAAGKKLADVFYNISTLDYDGILSVAQKEKIDGIMTICSDRPMRIVAKVSEELKLNSISTKTALLATNKVHMRNALKKNNVPIPKYAICSTKSEYDAAIRNIGLPAIVKPSDNSGSRGIVFLNDESDIEEAYIYASKNSMENVVLVEEYMDGDEVSVEVFVTNEGVNIVQITDKITTGAPHFVEMGHTQPSLLPFEIQNEIKKVTTMAVNAIGINGGPAHVELKVTSTGVKIVELGARLGGDFIATNLVFESTGVDLVKENILWSLNEEVEINTRQNRYAAIRYIGKLNSLMLDKESLSLLDAFMWHRNDSHMIESSRDRECALLISDNSIDGLNSKLETIRYSISVGDKECYW